jgi:hypothetical protein
MKPSVMFKNVLDNREKRMKNLRFIFNFYAKKNNLLKKTNSNNIFLNGSNLKEKN